MPMRNYGIYQQGAIFRQEDFDPVKVILALSEKIYELTLPDNILAALRKNEFSIEIVNELCEKMDIRIRDDADMTDFSCVSNALISEFGPAEWFNEPPVLMGSDDVYICVYSEIDGEFVYDADIENEDVEDCYILSLHVPIAWKLDSYSGPRTKEDALRCIKETAGALLKDNINWETRLGELIGASMA